MPQYLAPGVYVEEVPSAIKPIAGVGTSTAGFIGKVDSSVTMPLRPGKTAPEASEQETTEAESSTEADNPYYTLAASGEPQLITSWQSFKNTFGDIQTGNATLAHAVYGFFNNGGTRCWVVGINGDLAVSAGNGNVDKALAKLGGIDEISLVVVPGATTKAMQDAILAHCENMGDRFAILDGDQTTTLTATAIMAGGNSTYGAIYFPWLDVGATDENGATMYIPPSGHLAGVYARVDAERGVHKAPANEVIRGALGLEMRLSRPDQAGLNPDGVNVIRQFDGNVTVWGARTMADSTSPEWRYVSVRRTFIWLRESIDQGTGWVTFEPNTPDLWSRIRRNVGAFLTLAWSSGALFGTTPEQAFYVHCDGELNNFDVRQQGMVITEIGVAMVEPAEFVVFRVSQWAGPQG